MNAKTKVLLIGTAVGAALGTLGGLIYYNTNTSDDAEGYATVPSPTPGDVVKFGVAVLSAMRMLAT